MTDRPKTGTPVAPTYQELGGAPNPYGGSALPEAPDPFSGFNNALPGSPSWAGMAGYEKDLPGAPDQNTGTYGPQLPGAPEPFGGYSAMLDGSPYLAPQWGREGDSGDGEGQPSFLRPPQSVLTPEPQPLREQPQAPQYDLPAGPALHSPHWMT
jgi:hypothetical protein